MELEIWSDVACPWCYVGKRRLEAALARFEHADQVDVVWRSFELEPEAPAAHAESAAEHLAGKYGVSVEEARAMEDRMAQTAAADGLEFHFERLRSGSTFDAHRVLHLAREHGLQDAVKEHFMRAYLTEGELMSDAATLQRLAGEAGLPESAVAAVLASDRFADAVREDERTATALGASAVPFFVADRRLAAMGAQPADAMLALLEQAWAAVPRIPVVSGGEACGPEGC